MKKKFLLFRKKVFNYINTEIIPKEDNLEYCIMHNLPENISKDVEYIFKVKSTCPDEELSNLKVRIEKKLFEYCKNEISDFYISSILIILTKY